MECTKNKKQNEIMTYIHPEINRMLTLNKWLLHKSFNTEGCCSHLVLSEFY